MPRLVHILIVALAVGACPSVALGQNSQTSQQRPVTSDASGTEGRRAFAWWLEDADVLEARTAILGISVGRWQGIGGGQTDGPVLDANYGLTDFLQVSLSLPYYWAKDDSGFQAHGRGDSYLAAKFRLLDASESPVGIAISPTLEVLSDAAISDASLQLKRVNWALPVSVQIGSSGTRAYVSFGYFSRGAAFVGGAIERSLTERLTVSATFNFTRSMHTLASSTLEVLSRNRFDATIGGSVMIAPRVGAYVSVGRTISTLDENGARFCVGAGLSVTLGGSQAPQVK